MKRPFWEILWTPNMVFIFPRKASIIQNYRRRCELHDALMALVMSSWPYAWCTCGLILRCFLILDALMVHCEALVTLFWQNWCALVVLRVASVPTLFEFPHYITVGHTHHVTTCLCWAHGTVSCFICLHRSYLAAAHDCIHHLLIFWDVIDIPQHTWVLF